VSGTAIREVRARRVWDSRGHPTVEAEVALEGGARGRAIAPAGASTGSGEARDLRDGGAAFGGLDVSRAIAGVAEIIAPALRGIDAAEQQRIDETLRGVDGTPDKSRLGGNAIVAVSMAVAHAAAAQARIPLWLHMAGGAEPLLPLPEVQIFGGGAHANFRITIQDVMIMPLGARHLGEAIAWCAEVYRAAGLRLRRQGRFQGVADEGGYWPDFDASERALTETEKAIRDAGFAPGRDIALSLDIAATQLFLGKKGDFYRWDGYKSGAGPIVPRLRRLLGKFPVASIEDPVREDDDESWAAFTAEFGARVQIVGDDHLVTSAARVTGAAAARRCNAVLIKPNQAGTLSEAKAALDAARAQGWGTIVSARSGESEDTTIAHLAVGWRAGQIKVGSFARSERVAKWNELLRIEEALGAKARFAGRDALPVRR
jgi:enolase